MRMVNYLAAKNEILENWKNAFFVQLYIYNKEAAATFSDSFIKDLGELNELYDADKLMEEYEEWKSESDWFKNYSMAAVVTALKDEGAEVVKDKDDEDYTLRFYSKEGEDLCWIINKPKSAEDFAKKVEDIAENFDDEEHVRELLEAKNNGMQDIPSPKALVHDAEWIQEHLSHLSEVANKAAAGIERVSIKEILDRAKKEK